MARRRFQRGQLWKDGDRWMGRWYEDEIGSDGKVKRVRRQDVIAWVSECPTMRLAQRILDERLRPINDLNYKALPRIQFSALAQKWLNEVAIHHKPSTRAGSASIVACHLIPAFGAVPLKDITLERIQAFVNNFPHSAKTCRNVVIVLMGMWEMAMAWGYADHNPFPRGINGKVLLKMPRIRKAKTYAFTMEETLQIIAKAEGKWKLLFRTAAETGIRSGELAGLRRSDLQGRIITVGQSVFRQKVQTPKTDNAYRQIPISQALADGLREHIAGHSNDLIWTSVNGKPLHMSKVYKFVLDPILEELGIRAKLDRLGVRGGCYAFRRMNATMMDGLSVPLKTRQERFGHADPQTIMRHYTKEVDADNWTASEQIGTLLGSSTVQ